MAKKTKAVRLLLQEVTSDRNQFKPYSHKLTSDNIFVEVYVPEEEVLESNGKVIVLTVDGMAAVLGKVATAIETMHEEYRKEKFGH